MERADVARVRFLREALATPDAEIPVSFDRGTGERERWPPCPNSPTARLARSPQRHRSRSGRSGSRNGKVMVSRGGPRSIGWARVGWATMPEQPDRNRRLSAAELMPRKPPHNCAGSFLRLAVDPREFPGLSLHENLAWKLPGIGLSGPQSSEAGPADTRRCALKPKVAPTFHLNQARSRAAKKLRGSQ